MKKQTREKKDLQELWEASNDAEGYVMQKAMDIADMVLEGIQPDQKTIECYKLLKWEASQAEKSYYRELQNREVYDCYA